MRLNGKHIEDDQATLELLPESLRTVMRNHHSNYGWVVNYDKVTGIGDFITG